MYAAAAAAAAKSLQSCPTLCDPTDGSPVGSSVSGILQARIPEWVAISFSNARKWKAKVKSLSRAQLLATPWTAAYNILEGHKMKIIMKSDTLNYIILKHLSNTNDINNKVKRQTQRKY